MLESKAPTGSQAKKPALRLISSPLPAVGSCPETIATLERPLRAARAGTVIGLAYCALEGRVYTVDCVGTAAESPSDTRGMVCALDDELRRLNDQRADGAPTHEGY